MGTQGTSQIRIRRKQLRTRLRRLFFVGWVASVAGWILSTIRRAVLSTNAPAQFRQCTALGAALGAVASFALRRRTAHARAGRVVVDPKEPTLAMWCRLFGGFGFAVGVLSSVLAPRRLAAIRWPLSLPAPVQWGGVGLIAAAGVGWTWLYRSVAPGDRQRGDLVATGPYRWIRHPLYTCASLYWLGLALVSASGIALVSAVLLLISIFLRVPAEERALYAMLGAKYTQYSARTGRYLPRITRRRYRSRREL
ncbi:methyltransferase family protein [Haloferacaceae archaeon DSL9]